MFSHFTGVRRPRAGRMSVRRLRAAFSGLLLAGLIGGCAISRPADVGKGRLLEPVLPPIGALGSVLLIQPKPSARYAGTAKSARSSFVAPPDSLRTDTLALRRFEAGRLAAYAASPLLFRPQRRRMALPPPPPLPAFLRPADPAQTNRAAAAYSLGYGRQLAYAPPQKPKSISLTGLDNDGGTALGIFLSVGFVTLIVIAVLAALNSFLDSLPSLYPGSP